MKKHKHESHEEEVEAKETEANTLNTESVDIDPINIALARIETLENALKDAENDKYRALAEAQNMKKRVLADFDQKSKYMFKSAALELITVYENLQRAHEQALDYESLKKGLELALSGFNQVLSKEGVTKIDALHQPFNPEYHQALVVEESEEFEKDTVIEVYQDGYLLKDRLLRASMVKVSKEKEEN
jgi:molecular chaperone GrpE